MSAIAKGSKTRRPRVKAKGIFCIEGSWTGRVDRPMSVRPALELLKQWEPFNIPFVHRHIITRGEFEACLAKWRQSGSAKFPILYLAFHGAADTLFLGDARRRDNQVSLDEISDLLQDKCKRRIIHLGSCGTAGVNGHRLNNFLRKTGALAICGFREDVNWLESTAFELMIFEAMQFNAMTRSGAKAMSRRIKAHSGAVAKKLGFRMVVAQ